MCMKINKPKKKEKKTTVNKNKTQNKTKIEKDKKCWFTKTTVKSQKNVTWLNTKTESIEMCGSAICSERSKSVTRNRAIELTTWKTASSQAQFLRRFVCKTIFAISVNTEVTWLTSEPSERREKKRVVTYSREHLLADTHLDDSRAKRLAGTFMVSHTRCSVPRATVVNELAQIVLIWSYNCPTKRNRTYDLSFDRRKPSEEVNTSDTEGKRWCDQLIRVVPARRRYLISQSIKNILMLDLSTVNKNNKQ